MTTMAIASKFRTALRWSGREKLLIAEAIAALLSARVRSGLLPFRVLARQLKRLVPPDVAHSQDPPAPEDDEAIRAVRWAIRVAAPVMPFRSVCLQQAIAARVMLARRGIPSVMHLGVSHPPAGKMFAHAWLDAGERKVTGYPVDPALIEVGRFV